MSTIITPICIMLAMVAILLSMTLRNWGRDTAADAFLITTLACLLAAFTGVLYV